MDVNPCLKAPMYVSMPHFLDADPALLQNVKGLNPDVNEHGIEIDYEPVGYDFLSLLSSEGFNQNHSY